MFAARTFVTERTFVVKSIARAHVGKAHHRLTVFVVKAHHVTRNENGMHFAHARFSSLLGKVHGGFERGVPACGMSRYADSRFIYVIHVVGIVNIVDNGKRAVTFRRGGLPRIACGRIALGGGVDTDDHIAAPCVFQRHRGLRFLRPLKTGNDDDARRFVIFRRAGGLVKICRDVLPVLHGESYGNNVDFAPVMQKTACENRAEKNDENRYEQAHFRLVFEPRLFRSRRVQIVGNAFFRCSHKMQVLLF